MEPEAVNLGCYPQLRQEDPLPGLLASSTICPSACDLKHDATVSQDIPLKGHSSTQSKERAMRVFKVFHELDFIARLTGSLGATLATQPLGTAKHRI